MQKTPTTLLAALSLAALSLAGCAQMESSVDSLLSSHVPAYAVLDGVRYEGRATVYQDRSVVLQLASAQADGGACSGRVRYTGTGAGVLPLHCSGGRGLNMAFTSADGRSGVAQGTGPTPAGLVWGMDGARAGAYLPASAASAPSADSTPAL